MTWEVLGSASGLDQSEVISMLFCSFAPFALAVSMMESMCLFVLSTIVSSVNF